MLFLIRTIWTTLFLTHLVDQSFTLIFYKSTNHLGVKVVLNEISRNPVSNNLEY